MAKSLVLFDGVCHLCQGSVRFIIQRDRNKHFQFLPLQSAKAREFWQQPHTSGEVVDSVVLIEDGRVYTRSTAALRIARRLQGLWPLCYGFIVVPRPLRDAVYDLIGKYRYRLFGKSEQCMLPSPEYRDRFLDGG